MAGNPVYDQLCEELNYWPRFLVEIPTITLPGSYQLSQEEYEDFVADLFLRGQGKLIVLPEPWSVEVTTNWADQMIEDNDGEFPF